MKFALTALIPLLVITFISTTVVADQKSNKERQLRALQAKIKTLKQSIDAKQDKKSRYVAQLRHTEAQIGNVSKKVQGLEKDITAHKNTLHNLQLIRKQNQTKLAQAHHLLAQQVYAAYTLDKQVPIKLLFSQHNPINLQRNLVYYQYFSNARVRLINQVEQRIATIINTEKQINTVSQTLQTNYQVLKDQQARLDNDLIRRQTIITALNQQLKQQGNSLNQLQTEAEELQNLINSINKILTDIPAPHLNQRAFTALKGKLAWPVVGKVRRLFGRRKPQSDLRWKGIMIEAPNGQHVHAISYGRVAFADWLRGFGNLIIIDHGNTYLSLYGHNESLFKNTGEWVKPGDIIASVGRSGGQENPGLYFEIRRKGQPQNPLKWCRSDNQFASSASLISNHSLSSCCRFL